MFEPLLVNPLFVQPFAHISAARAVKKFIAPLMLHCTKNTCYAAMQDNPSVTVRDLTRRR
ncbi:hypothetical protein DK37_19255 [Halomonas sp. SUBG004]|nr:hypothetical protein DK37_19255 [Halomonas sp. SUBG004]